VNEYIDEWLKVVDFGVNETVKGMKSYTQWPKLLRRKTVTILRKQPVSVGRL
jgi:hypothetical protein